MAVDPKKVASEEPAPETDEVSAEGIAAPAETRDEGQDEAPQEPAYVAELRNKLTAAERAASDARDYARRAQGTSDKTAQRLEKEVRRISETLTKALTANMSEEEKRAFERDQRLERLEEERSAPQQNGDDPALRQWQSFASKALEKTGIKHDDPTLTKLFYENGGNSSNPDDWEVALVAAIDAIRKGETEKARTESQKTADDDKVKARNAARRAEGKIDRGSPSGAARERVADMSDEEFDKHWAQKVAAANKEAAAGR